MLRQLTLALLKGLLDLLQVREMADVAGDALGSGSQGGEGIRDPQVDLAGVGLGRDGVYAGKPCFLWEPRAELAPLHHPSSPPPLFSLKRV